MKGPEMQQLRELEAAGLEPDYPKTLREQREATAEQAEAVMAAKRAALKECDREDETRAVRRAMRMEARSGWSNRGRAGKR
jgi:hypothetical protein